MATEIADSACNEVPEYGSITAVLTSSKTLKGRYFSWII